MSGAPGLPERVDTAMFRLRADIGGLRAAGICLSNSVGDDDGQLNPFDVERMLLGLIENLDRRAAELADILEAEMP